MLYQEHTATCGKSPKYFFSSICSTGSCTVFSNFLAIHRMVKWYCTVLYYYCMYSTVYALERTYCTYLYITCTYTVVPLSASGPTHVLIKGAMRYDTVQTGMSKPMIDQINRYSL
jgi:hypothetical protein